MAKYVDGFVTPVKKKNLQAYRRLAQMAGKIFVSTAPLSSANALAMIST